MSDVVLELKDNGKSCCGCFACFNACPSDAVKMVVGKDGLCKSQVDSLACIDCGLCIKKCPQLNTEHANEVKPRSYAFRADDATVEASASGGAFIVLADWMLSRGGYVCGVVYDDRLDAKYVMTKDRDVVERMRKTKYAFSEMGEIFKEIDSALNSGEEVLFVGCPCQVSAVKLFVKDPSKLYTVDLLCAGLPAKGIYRRYLDELSAKKKVVNLSFRESDLPYGTLVVDYEDGTRKTIFKDPYFQGFLRHMFKSEACSNCKYAATPRIGDLTIGDLWQYDKILFDVDASTGISCVLVNNKRGRAMFGALSEKASYLRDIPLSFLKRFNRFNEVRPNSPASARFQYLLGRGHPVSKALDYAINAKYDVAVTGFWRVVNYGGDLTYYALYNVLLDMGLEPIFVEACSLNASGIPPSPSRMLTKYPDFSRAPWCTNKDKQSEINLRVKNILVGSDQVWNPKLLSPEGLRAYALDFAFSWRNTVAYASSFGTPTYVDDSPLKKEHIKLLKKIKHVSVREISGVEICSKYGIEAKHVLDPVFLCDKRHYKALIDKAAIVFPERYMMAFVRHVNVHMDPMAMASHLGMQAISVGGPDMDYDKDVGYPMFNVNNVENWLKAVYHSSFILTDSYHATALAILFRKQFIAVYGRMDESTGTGRMSSLLGVLGLQDRLFKTTEDAINAGAPKKPIDYDAVDVKLSAFRKECLEWLKNALDV
jgi:coenzyme F420-reducing hydrogenase beta subunit